MSKEDKHTNLIRGRAAKAAAAAAAAAASDNAPNVAPSSLPSQVSTHHSDASIYLISTIRFPSFRLKPSRSKGMHLSNGLRLRQQL